jgi:hypothetical protein
MNIGIGSDPTSSKLLVEVACYFEVCGFEGEDWFFSEVICISLFPFGNGDWVLGFGAWCGL